MRLHGYGPGEIADRLSILELKTSYGRSAGMIVLHFEEEHRALEKQNDLTKVDPTLLIQLTVINARLWQAEDILREHRVDEEDKIGEGTTIDRLIDISRLAFQIQDLNDQRATLIHAINELAGKELGREKL